MADLNIRNVPEALMRKLKAGAAAGGVTLREYVLEKLDPTMNSELWSVKRQQRVRQMTGVGADDVVSEGSVKIRHLATSNWRTCMCEHCVKKRKDLE